MQSNYFIYVNGYRATHLASMQTSSSELASTMWCLPICTKFADIF